LNKDLVTELKKGSSQAFNTLFEKYNGKIYNFSLGYLNDREEAKEIVQDVFLKIWNAREDLSEEKSLDSYLFTIAKNTILNTIRKSNYHQAYLNYVAVNQEKDILTEDEIDFQELEKAYKKVVGMLPSRRKEIFLLSREKGLSNAEIAQTLGISVKTVENQMTSALADIKRNLTTLGFSYFLFFKIFLENL
jgi:RNA polymerase sigma-70 factor (ECF subfamily)